MPLPPQGKILVALNPFADLPIYGDAVMANYMDKDVGASKVEPHVYAMGEGQAPHSVHPHAVHLPRGALLSWRALCGCRRGGVQAREAVEGGGRAGDVG